MKQFLCIAALMLFVPFPLMGEPVPSCTLADSRVASLIQAKAKQLKGEEYCQFRHYDQMDDVNGDGVDDFIVLFTIESPGGGNDHINFLAVFPSSKGAPAEPITVETGRRGEHDPTAVSVEDGKIVLETQEYLKTDPMCCPSGKGKLVYTLTGNRLQLEK